MNILFVTPHMITGGTERMIADLGKGLLSNGHNVGIATSGGHLLNEMAAAGAKVHVKPSLAKRKPHNLFINGLWLSKVVRENQYNLINSHSLLTTWVSKIGAAVSMRSPRKIYTMHLIENPKAFKYIRIMTNLTSDSIITVSESNKSRLIETGIKASKINVIHNGINLDKFPYFQRKPTNEPTIGIVARMIPRKGHEILLRAISNLSRKFNGDWAKLMIIGWGPLEEQLKSLCYELKIEHIVQFLGDRHDVPELLQKMDILVLPSFYEGFPISIIEGMATGLPVIATNIDGIPEIINPGANGLLVAPGEVEDLEIALTNMLGNYDLRVELGNEASTIARKHFSISRMTEETERVFMAALK